MRVRRYFPQKDNVVYRPLRAQHVRLPAALEIGMSHNLASGIISAAVLPFDDSGAIDWTTMERYIVQVAAGQAACDRDEYGGQASRARSKSPSSSRSSGAARPRSAGACMLLSGLNVTPHGCGGRLARKLVDAGAEGWSSLSRRCRRSQRADSGADGRGLPSRGGRGCRRADGRRSRRSFAAIRKARSCALSQIPIVVAIKDASFNVDNTVDQHQRSQRRRSAGSAC